MQDALPVSANDIRRAAMDLLARREHGREELSDKLRRRFAKRQCPPGMLEAALDTLEQEGLLSDTRFAESLLRQLLSKGVGPLKLRQELALRRLSPDALAHIEPDIAAVDWFVAAETVYAKKFGEGPAWVLDFPGLRREQARRIRFMQYRGFKAEHFQHLLESLNIQGDEEVIHDGL